MKHQMTINKALIGCLLVFFSLGLSAQVDLQSGLQAWYPFNGNAEDESGKMHHATTYNDPQLTSDRFGNKNSAYLFDGKNDYMDTRTSFDYEYKTVSVWFQPNQVNGTFSIVNQDANTLRYGLAGLHIVDGNIVCYPGGSVNGFTTAATANEWAHVVYIRNGSATSVYLNGVLAFTGSSGTDGSSYYPYINTVIGTTRTRTRNFFDGKIDDVRIYNRALNAEEVLALYSGDVSEDVSANVATPEVYTLTLPPVLDAVASTLDDQIDPDHPFFRTSAWTMDGKPFVEMGLMKFDFSQLPPNARIESATLQLKGFEHNPEKHSNDAKIYPVSNDWTKGMATGELIYNDKYFAVVDGTTDGEVTNENRDIDIKSLVQKWIGGYPNHGLLLKIDNADPHSLMNFLSIEGGKKVDGPVLSIHYSLDQSAFVEWDVERSQEIDIDQHTLTRPKGGNWDGVAISTSWIESQRGGYLEFMVQSEKDVYCIGFSDHNDPSPFEENLVTVNVRPGEASGTCDLNFITFGDEIRLTGILPFDVIRISKELNVEGKWMFKLYVNGSEFESCEVREDKLPTLFVKAHIYTSGGSLSNVKYAVEGLNYFVNDNSRENDIWCTAIGSAENDGLSPASPLPSLALINFDKLLPNDRILIDAGEYKAETIQLRGLDLGSADQPIHIQGAGRGLTQLKTDAGSVFFIEHVKNLDISNLSILSAHEDLNGEPLIHVVGSSSVDIRDCYIQSDKQDGGVPVVLMLASSDLLFEANVILSNSRENPLVIADGCNGLRIERNRMKGGDLNLMLADKAGVCSNFAINRNFFVTDGAGIYLFFEGEEPGTGSLFNNSFFTRKASLNVENNRSLNNVSFANNILNTTDGFDIDINNFREGDGYFALCSYNLYAPKEGENYVRFSGVQDFHFEAYMEYVSGMNESYEAGSFSADPVFLNPESANLNVQESSPANLAAYQFTGFEKRIDINGEQIGASYRFGGGSFAAVYTKNYAELKKKLDASYHLMNRSKLHIKYKEEYFTANTDDLVFNIYNAHHKVVATQLTHPSLLQRDFGENYIQIDLCGISGGHYMILEVINAKDEKWYLRFKTNPLWYLMNCPLEVQNDPGTIGSAIINIHPQPVP